FHSVAPVAEIHLVQVRFEDLIFRIQALDSRRQDQLLEFAMERLVRTKEALSRQLLRDGAAALRRAPAADVRDRRRCDADQVEAAMLVEALIFDVENRVDQIRRDLGERHIDALLLVDRERHSVRGVEDRRRLVHLADFADGVLVWEAVTEAIEEPRTAANRDEREECERDEQRRNHAWMPLARASPVVAEMT